MSACEREREKEREYVGVCPLLLNQRVIGFAFICVSGTLAVMRGDRVKLYSIIVLRMGYALYQSHKKNCIRFLDFSISYLYAHI